MGHIHGLTILTCGQALSSKLKQTRTIMSNNIGFLGSIPDITSSMTLEVRRYLNEDWRYNLCFWTCNMESMFLQLQYVLELANCILEHMVYVVLELNIHTLFWKLMVCTHV